MQTFARLQASALKITINKMQAAGMCGNAN